jgi:hypothetical protein
MNRRKKTQAPTGDALAAAIRKWRQRKTNKRGGDASPDDVTLQGFIDFARGEWGIELTVAECAEVLAQHDEGGILRWFLGSKSTLRQLVAAKERKGFMPEVNTAVLEAFESRENETARLAEELQAKALELQELEARLGEREERAKEKTERFKAWNRELNALEEQLKAQQAALEASQALQAQKETEVAAQFAELETLIARGENAEAAISRLEQLVAEMRELATSNAAAASELAGVKEMAAQLPQIVSGIRETAQEVRGYAATQAQTGKTLAEILSLVMSLGNISKLIENLRAQFREELAASKEESIAAIRTELKSLAESATKKIDTAGRRWNVAYSTGKQALLDRLERQLTGKRLLLRRIGFSFIVMAALFGANMAIMMTGLMHNDGQGAFWRNLWAGYGGFLNWILPF